MTIDWHFAQFAHLTPQQVHDLYEARVAVFVVEQNCVFQDVDGADPDCWHLFGRDPSGTLFAYCRLVPPGVKFDEPSIGRVLTTKAGRGSGVGRELMAEAVARAQRLWPGQALRIGAQLYLDKFYGEFGFTQVSDPYLEDGIMHIEMLPSMAITLILLAGFAAPILAAVACVVIARHLYPPGRRLWAGLAGVVGSIGLPVLVILTIRNARELHDRFAGDLGPFVSIVLFAGSSLIAPGMLLWLRKGFKSQ